MKLRLKIGGQSRPLDLGNRDPSSVTLADLKDSVSETFLLQTEDIRLSLNKIDLLTENESTLEDLGIVPGDLIHVLTDNGIHNYDNLPQANSRQPLLSSVNTSKLIVLDKNQHSNSTNDESTDPNGFTQAHGTSSSESQPPSLSSSEENRASKMVVEEETADLIPRPMKEPLVIGESTQNQVPALLSDLYTNSSITSANDALFVLLHALMIESGFTPSQCSDITCMPPDWKRPGFYCCTYQYVLTSEVTSECNLMAVPTGTSMAVHGLSKMVGNFKTDLLHVKTENYIRDISIGNAPAAYRSLDRISKQFKDNICLSLHNQLATAAGFRETQGLLSLPCEVRMRLLCFLDAPSVCRLGQTCHQWNAIYKDNILWRRLYLKAFDSPADTRVSRDWFKMFQTKYEQFKVQQEERRRLMADWEDFYRPVFPGNPFGPFHPNRRFPPHILGGEHDLVPQYPPGVPDLLGGMRGPRHVPFDPARVIGGPQGQGQQRRTLPGSANSPFFNMKPFM